MSASVRTPLHAGAPADFPAAPAVAAAWAAMLSTVAPEFEADADEDPALRPEVAVASFGEWRKE